MSEQPIILIVEDNQQINHLFCKKLGAAGYTCRGVHSIGEAVNSLKTDGLPSLIVLDLELGDGYGTEVLDYLKASDQADDTRIIVVSANAFSFQYPLDNYRVDHTLLKPVSPRGLSALIKETLAELPPSPRITLDTN